jgi:hypothetical protein
VVAAVGKRFTGRNDQGHNDCPEYDVDGHTKKPVRGVHGQEGGETNVVSQSHTPVLPCNGSLYAWRRVASSPSAGHSGSTSRAGHAFSVEGIDGNSLDAVDGSQENVVFKNAIGNLGIGTTLKARIETLERLLATLAEGQNGGAQ